MRYWITAEEADAALRLVCGTSHSGNELCAMPWSLGGEGGFATNGKLALFIDAGGRDLEPVPQRRLALARDFFDPADCRLLGRVMLPALCGWAGQFDLESWERGETRLARAGALTFDRNLFAMATAHLGAALAYRAHEYGGRGGRLEAPPVDLFVRTGASDGSADRVLAVGVGFRLCVACVTRQWSNERRFDAVSDADSLPLDQGGAT